MRLLNIRRLLPVVFAGLALLAINPFATAWPEDEAPPEDPFAGEPSEEAGEQPLEGGDPANIEIPTGLIPGQEDVVIEIPNVRRRAPRTDQEEREYKLLKAQTDPFMEPPDRLITEYDIAAMYSPEDWLLPLARTDLTRYIVQNSAGEVIGYLSASYEKIFEPSAGELMQVTMRHEYGKDIEVVMQLDLQTLKPRYVARRKLHFSRPPDSRTAGNIADAIPGVLPLQDQTLMKVEYNFDRAGIEQTLGGFTTLSRMRVLPYTYDRDELTTLVRQLDYRHPDWPFEALIIDPGIETHLPLSIGKPERVDALSAEPRLYACFELQVRMGDIESTWWVERIPPNRLVKFNVGGYTYTLFQYAENK